MNKQEIEKAIQALQLFKQPKGWDIMCANGESMNNVYDLAISALQIMLLLVRCKDDTQQLNNGWIPVTNDDDHYPKAFKNVSFTDGYNVYVGYCDSDYTWFATDGEHTNEIELVTAWKIDEPYREVSK
jgi:hypothetical protein